MLDVIHGQPLNSKFWLKPGLSRYFLIRSIHSWRFSLLTGNGWALEILRQELMQHLSDSLTVGKKQTTLITFCLSLGILVSISQTFSEQLFCTEVLVFLQLLCVVVVFEGKEIGEKADHKMLVKLTTWVSITALYIVRIESTDIKLGGYWITNIEFRYLFSTRYPARHLDIETSAYPWRLKRRTFCRGQYNLTVFF